MCLHEHVGDDHFIGEFGVFPSVAWIDMVANEKPGPAIKAAGPHTADVIGWQILPDFVPLIGAHPEFIAARSKCDPDSVSNSPRINFLPAAIGFELEDARAICFRGVVGNIGTRSD